MAKRKPHKRSRRSSDVSLRRSTDGSSWVLVHPKCCRERAEDIAEVREMIEAEELDVATDELHWLISGCSEFIEAHGLLGELALAAHNDIPLARGHFGFAYQLGLQAVQRESGNMRLLYGQPANQPFFLAGQGLAWCLYKLGKEQMSREIVDQLLSLDPVDRPGLKAMLDTLASDGLPVVDLLDSFPSNRKDGK